MVSLTSKIHFLCQVYPVKCFLGQKVEYAENLNLSLLQTGLSLKTRLSLYLALNLTKKTNFKIFIQKIKCTTMPGHHVKGQPEVSTFV